MFEKALLESAPTLRKRRHWPMATAFTAELIVAAVLVLLPLISTGVISLKATVIVPTPPKYTRIERKQPTPPASGSHSDVSAPVARVIPISTSGGIRYGKPVPTTGPDSSEESPNLNLPGGGDPKGVDWLRGAALPVKPVIKPPVISRTTEAMLLRKVVPEYPQIAKLAGIQGDVKLHAFVSKNGDIISLTVLGTPPPVLSQAALNAVQQWKYRPYYLNGEPVEIETFVTVTFKRTD